MAHDARLQPAAFGRDDHLRSADCFDAEAHPTITFEASPGDHRGGGRHRIPDSLDMHGVTKPVVLEAEVAEPITDPFGQRRVAATASRRIKRKDWGRAWNSPLETGALLVSEEVTLQIDAQATADATRNEAVVAST